MAAAKYSTTQPVEENLKDGAADKGKKKFRPFQAMRKLFRSNRKPTDKTVREEAKHGGALRVDGGDRFRKSSRQSRLQNTRSTSEDSIFLAASESNDTKRYKKSAVSTEGLNTTGVQSELMSKLIKRRSMNSDDDGLPRSPGSSFTTADYKAGLSKSGSRDSDRSLLSIDGSENDEEDLFARTWTSSIASVVQKDDAKIRGSQVDTHDLDLGAVQTTANLNISLAKHRISVRPQQRRLPQRAHKRQRVSMPTGLPQLKEELPGKGAQTVLPPINRKLSVEIEEVGTETLQPLKSVSSMPDPTPKPVTIMDEFKPAPSKKSETSPEITKIPSPMATSTLSTKCIETDLKMTPEKVVSEATLTQRQATITLPSKTIKAFDSQELKPTSVLSATKSDDPSKHNSVDDVVTLGRLEKSDPASLTKHNGDSEITKKFGQLREIKRDEEKSLTRNTEREHKDDDNDDGEIVNSKAMEFTDDDMSDILGAISVDKEVGKEKDVKRKENSVKNISDRKNLYDNVVKVGKSYSLSKFDSKPSTAAVINKHDPNVAGKLEGISSKFESKQDMKGNVGTSKLDIKSESKEDSIAGKFESKIDSKTSAIGSKFEIKSASCNITTKSETISNMPHSVTTKSDTTPSDLDDTKKSFTLPVSSPKADKQRPTRRKTLPDHMSPKDGPPTEDREAAKTKISESGRKSSFPGTPKLSPEKEISLKQSSESSSEGSSTPSWIALAKRKKAERDEKNSPEETQGKSVTGNADMGKTEKFTPANLRKFSIEKDKIERVNENTKKESDIDVPKSEISKVGNVKSLVESQKEDVKPTGSDTKLVHRKSEIQLKRVISQESDAQAKSKTLPNASSTPTAEAKPVPLARKPTLPSNKPKLSPSEIKKSPVEKQKIPELEPKTLAPWEKKTLHSDTKKPLTLDTNFNKTGMDGAKSTMVTKASFNQGRNTAINTDPVEAKASIDEKKNNFEHKKNPILKSQSQITKSPQHVRQNMYIDSKTVSLEDNQYDPLQVKTVGAKFESGLGKQKTTDNNANVPAWRSNLKKNMINKEPTPEKKIEILSRPTQSQNDILKKIGSTTAKKPLPLGSKPDITKVGTAKIPETQKKNDEEESVNPLIIRDKVKVEKKCDPMSRQSKVLDMVKSFQNLPVS